MIENSTYTGETTEEIEAREPTEYEKAKHLEEYVHEIESIKQSATYTEVDNGREQEYQRCFTEAMTEDDPMKRAHALERMKGIALARGIIDKLRAELESEINYLIEEAQE